MGMRIEWENSRCVYGKGWVTKSCQLGQSNLGILGRVSHLFEYIGYNILAILVSYLAFGMIASFITGFYYFEQFYYIQCLVLADWASK